MIESYFDYHQYLHFYFIFNITMHKWVFDLSISKMTKFWLNKSNLSKYIEKYNKNKIQIVNKD